MLRNDPDLDINMNLLQNMERGPRCMKLRKLNNYIIYLFIKKGHALAEKAGAQTDFSYVPGHLGKF